jgi:hypothetical protein
MSWADYVTGYLVNFTDQSNGKSAFNISENGALIGNQDGTVWASTQGFTMGTYKCEVDKDDGSTESVNVNEFENLLDAFNNSGVSTKKGGIRINNEKYFIVSFDAERGVMYLKKSGGGAAVAKSNLAFVISTFSSKKKLKNFNNVDEPQNPGMTNRVVEELQKFLLENSL